MMNKTLFKTLLFLFICLNTILVCVNIALVLLKPNDAFDKGTSSHDRLERLLLSPHIKEGHINEAQKLAKVYHEQFFSIESYTGYLTVNGTTDSHMFFWYFPAARFSSKVPLLLWLSGGPGWSSMFGLFAEVGPFGPVSPTELNLRKHSWYKQYNLLFLDNPVGTGFSRTVSGYTTNEVEVGRDLLIVMRQFLKLFPELANKDFYITGESYGAKYVVALGHAIHVYNQKAKEKEKIKMMGLMLGGGMFDQVNQMNYADYYYQLGVINMQQAAILKTEQDKCIALIHQKKYSEAVKVFNGILFENLTSLAAQFTGFTNTFNYLLAEEPTTMENNIMHFLNQRDVKRAIHVDEREFTLKDMMVSKSMQSDVPQSVALWISELLSYYKVLIYGGQLDVSTPYPGIRSAVMNLKFSGDEEYANAPREKWYFERDLAGYVTQGGNLTEVMVRNCGHKLPIDQPEWVLDLIDKFIHNKTFN